MFLQLIIHFSILAGDWKAANEDLTVSCRYIIKNQTTGDRLNIRVVAVNPGGRSAPATLARRCPGQRGGGVSQHLTSQIFPPTFFHK